MAKKRLVESSSPTDEWGIYDPAKAGMQALYQRLGRPIIRSSAASARRDRRRADRPERTADGVGLAIEEAKQRAVLKAAAAAAPFVPPLAQLPPHEPDVAPAIELKKKPARAAAAAAKAPKSADKRKRAASAMVAAPPAADADIASEPGSTAAPMAAPIAPPTAKLRGRKAARTRDAAAPVAAATPPPAAAIPPPSPGRPRGPVPLAAWAHAVSDAPRPEPRRADVRGLWRGIFRIPSDVALVEYGRGCRIHRLVIETPPELFPGTF